MKNPALCRLLALGTLPFTLFTAPLSGQAAEDHRARDIATIVAAYHQMGRFQGAVLVAEGDEILLRRAYGLASVELEVANRPETRFLLASVSKSFTATAILRLRQQGKVELEVPLSRYLPAFEREIADKVTIHQLLTHTAGLHRDMLSATGRSRGEHFTTSELLGIIAEQGFLYDPGSRRGYSSQGYVLLAAVVEAVTGRSFDQALDALVFAPLGMNDTSFEVVGRIVPQRASRYQYLVDELIVAPFEDPSFAQGSGSVSSTVDDLWKWCRALVVDGFLTAESRALMLSEQVKGNGYGVWSYAYKTGPRFDQAEGRGVGYSGGAAGVGSIFNVFLDHGIVVVVLSNYTENEVHGISNRIGNVALGLPKELPSVSNARLEVFRSALDEGVDTAFSQLQALREAEQPIPGFGEAFRIGYAYFTQHRLEEARVILELTARAFPKYNYAHVVLGRIHRQTGNAKAACDAFAKALDVDPADIVAKAFGAGCGGQDP